MPAALIDVGHHLVEPNQSGQTVSISVVSSEVTKDLVSGFDLRAQIVTDKQGPSFEDVKFAGSLWNLFPHVESGGPLPTNRSIATGEVAFTDGFSARPDGTLVTFGIDTKGIAAGSYEFRLVGTAIGESSFVGKDGAVVSEVFGNGTLQVRSIWQNPYDANDVNEDGSITPLDVLLVLSKLNKEGTYEVEMPTTGAAPPPFYDVNGDGHVSPADALGPINCLNGLGCHSTPAPIMASVTPDFEQQPADTTGTGSSKNGGVAGTGNPSDPLTGESTPDDHEVCEYEYIDEDGVLVVDPVYCEEEFIDTDPEPIDPISDEPPVLPDADPTPPLPTGEESKGSLFSAIVFGPQQRVVDSALDELLHDTIGDLVDLELADDLLDAIA